MKTDLIIDGMLSGTGVRDAVAGGYIAPDATGLLVQLVADIAGWHRMYEEAHFAGFLQTPRWTTKALTLHRACKANLATKRRLFLGRENGATRLSWVVNF